MTDALTARIALAEGVIAEATACAMAYFARRSSLSVDCKSDAQDLVSEADRGVETLISDRLTRAFPDDSLLGEELGLAPQEGQSVEDAVKDKLEGELKRGLLKLFE